MKILVLILAWLSTCVGEGARLFFKAHVSSLGKTPTCPTPVFQVLLLRMLNFTQTTTTTMC